jgi:hypothetical protein
LVKKLCFFSPSGTKRRETNSPSGTKKTPLRGLFLPVFFFYFLPLEEKNQSIAFGNTVCLRQKKRDEGKQKEEGITFVLVFFFQRKKLKEGKQKERGLLLLFPVQV